MQEEAEYQIKNEIHKQIKSLIEENKNEIQDALVTKIVKEMMNQMCFSIPLKEILNKKIIEGINNRYSQADTYNLFWDISLSDKLKEVYDADKERYNTMLTEKLNKTLKDYKVDNYIISNELSQILTTNHKYQTTLKDFLDSRIDDILDKI